MTELSNDSTSEALKRLEGDGSNLSLPMEIDFFVAFHTEQDAKKFELSVPKLEFDTSVEQDDESMEWTCYCSKNIIPNYDEVVKIEETLTVLAKKFGGEYDGFGSFGNS